MKSVRFIRSFRGRLVLAVALVLAVLMTFFVVDMVRRQRQALVRHLQERAGTTARLLAASGKGWVAAHDVAGLEEILRAQALEPDLEFALYTDASGQVLAHTDRTKLGLIVADMPSRFRETLLASNDLLVDFALPVFLDSVPVGWVRVGLNPEPTRELSRALLWQGVLYSSVAIVAGTFFAVAMASYLTRRLQRIQRTMERFRNGDRSQRSHLSGADELAVLSTGLDLMLSDLQAQERSLEAAHLELQSQNATLEHAVHARTEALRQRTQQLGAQQRALEAAQAIAHLGSWVHDIPNDSLVGSPEAYAILGLEPDTPLTQQRFIELVHAEDRERIKQAWYQTMKEGTAHDVEHRVETPQGTRWLRERAEVEYSAAGEPVRGLRTVQDITQQKEQELALRQSEARARAILDASPVPMAIHDTATRALHLNPAFVETFGYTLSELPDLAAWWPRAYPDPEYRQWVADTWAARLREADLSGKFDPLEVEVRCRDGRTRRVQAVGTRLRGAEAGVTLISLYDITPLHNAHQRLQTLLDTVSDAIHIIDAEGRLVQWSQSFLQSLGCTAAEAEGLHVWDWRADATREEILEQLPSMLADLQSHSRTIDARHRCKDGSLIDVELNLRGTIVDGKPYIVASGRDVTARRQADATLRLEVEKNRTLLQQASDGVHILDLRGHLVEASDSFARMLGYQRHEVIGMHVSQWDERIPTKGMESVILSHFEGGRRVEFTTVHRRRDGSVFEVEISGSPLSLANAPVMYYSARDISQRQAEEQVLRDALLETRRLNDVMQGREETIVALKREVDKLSLELGRPPPFPTCAADPIDFGEPVVRPSDVPVRLEVLDDLQPWQQLLDAVCDAAGVAAAIIDLQGRILLASRWQPICARFHRVAPESQRNCTHSDTVLATELLKKCPLAIYTCCNGMTDAAAPIVLQGRHVANVFIGQILTAPPDIEFFTEQARRFGYDEEQYLEALKQVSVLDPQRIEIALNAMRATAELVALTALDARRRKRLHELWRTQQLNLLSVAEDAKHAQELSERANRAKSAFLANMSHEIRTPLNGVIGLTHLMFETSLSPRQRDYMSKIRSSSDALRRILNDVLDYSKLEANRMVLDQTPFRLDDMVARVSNLFSFAAEEKNLELLFELTPRLPVSLVGDSMRLEQIVTNLLGNAIKFTERGEVLLKFDAEENADGSVQLLGSVRDTGIGIPEAVQVTLFQAFTQADTSTTRRFGGSGLGLAICRRLATLMGGDIQVESAVGSGSTFSFTVKMERGPVAPAGLGSTTALRGMRALVADDNTTSLEILRQTLEAWSLEVDTARNGAEALDKIRRSRASGKPFGVVLLDWKMPEFDGLQVASALEQAASARTSSRPPLVMIVSALGKDVVRQEAHGAHFEAILDKPVIPSALFDVLMNIRSNQQPGKNSVASAPSLRERTRPLWGARVLLAEDNAVNQLVGKGLLEQLGLIVDLAEDGEMAVTMSQRTRYACILMDLHMPKMDGVEATRRIRQTAGGTNVPILAMTAAALATDRATSIAAGMNDHVSKPIDPELLVQALLSWIPATSLGQLPDASPVTPRESGDRFELPGFDLEAAAYRMGGDWNGLHKVLRGFATECAPFGSEVAAAVESGRWEAAILRAHTLKGAAGNLGNARLHALAQELEAGLRRKDASALGEVREQLATALGSISKLAAEEPKPVSPDNSGPEELAKDIDALRRMLLEQRLLPEELLARFRQQLAGGSHDEVVGRFADEVDAFQYAKALTTLNELAMRLGLATT